MKAIAQTRGHRKDISTSRVTHPLHQHLTGSRFDLIQDVATAGKVGLLLRNQKVSAKLEEISPPVQGYNMDIRVPQFS